MNASNNNSMKNFNAEMMKKYTNYDTVTMQAFMEGGAAKSLSIRQKQQQYLNDPESGTAE